MISRIRGEFGDPENQRFCSNRGLFRVKVSEKGGIFSEWGYRAFSPSGGTGPSPSPNPGEVEWTRRICCGIPGSDKHGGALGESID